jgi:hypothetical protein
MVKNIMKFFVTLDLLKKATMHILIFTISSCEGLVMIEW